MLKSLLDYSEQGIQIYCTLITNRTFANDTEMLLIPVCISDFLYILYFLSSLEDGMNIKHCALSVWHKASSHLLIKLKQVWKYKSTPSMCRHWLTLYDCPWAWRFHQLVRGKKPSTLKARGSYSMDFILCIDHAVGRTRCLQILMSLTIYPAESYWQLDICEVIKGTTSNTLEQKLSNLDMLSFSLNHSNQWIGPITKAHIKSCSSPLFQPRAGNPQESSLLLLQCGRWDRQLWLLQYFAHKHTDNITNRDPGFCRRATSRCVCCLCVNMISVILFEPVLPYRGREGVYLCMWPKLSLFLYLQCTRTSLSGSFLLFACNAWFDTRKPFLRQGVSFVSSI